MGTLTKNSEKGFTLIELLVVIAIIGILASMMMPAVGEAKKKGEIQTCKSNLRQMYVMASNYSADHNGDMVMPFTGREDSRGDWYVSAFTNALGGVSSTEPNLMHCPTQYKIMKKLPLNSTIYTYSENHQLTSESFGDSIRTGGAEDRTDMTPLNIYILGLDGDSRGGKNPASPSNVAYFLDGWHSGPNSAFATWRIWGHVSYYASLGPTSLESAFPHDWKCNIVFLDGHAETTQYQEGIWEGSYPANWNNAPHWLRKVGDKGWNGTNGGDSIRAF